MSRRRTRELTPVGNRLAHRIAAGGWASQAAFARAVGISPTNFSHMLAGKPISDDRKVKIADLLGITLAELFDDRPETRWFGVQGRFVDAIAPIVEVEGIVAWTSLSPPWSERLSVQAHCAVQEPIEVLLKETEGFTAGRDFDGITITLDQVVTYLKRVCEAGQDARWLLVKSCDRRLHCLAMLSDPATIVKQALPYLRLMMKAYQAVLSTEVQAMALARKGDVLSIHGSHDWTAFRRASEALNDVTSSSSKRLGYHFVRSFVRVMARGQNGSEFRTALRVAEEWIASGRLNDAEVRHLLDGMAEGHAYRYSMTGEGYHRREALRCYTRAGEFQNLVASTELALRYLRLPLLLAEFGIPELVDTSGQQALQLQRRAKELGSPRVYTATKQMHERLVAKGIIKPKQS